MSDGESLLDAFVNVSVRGMKESEEDVKQFVARVSNVFGPLTAGTIKVKAQVNAQQAVQSAKAAVDGMRAEVLRFEQEKFELDFAVRLLGRQDITRQFADIQSEVRAAQKAFALAEPGAAGDTDRAAAINRVTAARERELAALRDLVQSQLQSTGLDAAYEDRKQQFDAIRDSVRSINTQLSETSRLVSLGGGSLQLRDELEQVRSSIKRTIDDITRFSAQGDLLNAEQAVQQLRTLETALNRIQSQANIAIAGRIDTQAAQSSLDDLLSQFAIKKGELSIKLRLLGSDVAKSKLQDIATQIQNLSTAFEAADKAGNLTARANALQEINRLIANGTRLLEQDIDAQIAAKGLSTYEDRKKQFDAIRDSVRSVNTQLSETSRLISLGGGSLQLRDDLEQVRSSIKRTIDDITRFSGQGELLNAQQAVQQLRTLETALNRIQSRANIAIAGKIDTQAAQSSLDDLLSQFAIKKGELSIKLRLLGSDVAKSKLQDIATQIQNLSTAFEAADKAGNLTARANALQEINRLIANGTRLLEQDIDAQIAAKGLSVGLDQVLSRFNVASQQAQKFKDNLDEAQKTAKQLGNTRISNFIEEYKKQYRDLQRTLNTAVAANDLVGAENAIQQMNALDGKIQRIRQIASRRISINISAKTTIDEALNEWRTAMISMSALQQGSVGKLTGQQKQYITELRAEADLLLYKMQQISKQDIISVAQSQELMNTRARLAMISGELETVFQTASKNGRSFNTLNNNAYQLGQAIEDAAIGAEFNGIAGAIRGAANNVSFLINNFAQSTQAVTIFGEAAAANLALVAGIGSALAIVVLPRLAEFLQTLNDINSETKDISKSLSETLKDIELQIELQIDRESSARAIGEAKDIIDAIKAIVSQAEQQKELQINITSQIQGLSTGTIAAEIKNTVNDLKNVIDTEIKSLQGTVYGGAAGAPGAGFMLPNVSQNPLIKQFEELALVVEKFEIAQKSALDASKSGIVDKAAIEAARDALGELEQRFAEFQNTGRLGEGTSGILKQNIEAARNAYKDLNDEAAKLANEQQKQIDAQDELIRRAQQFGTFGVDVTTPGGAKNAIASAALTDQQSEALSRILVLRGEITQEEADSVKRARELGDLREKYASADLSLTEQLKAATTDLDVQRIKAAQSALEVLSTQDALLLQTEQLADLEQKMVDLREKSASEEERLKEQRVKAEEDVQKARIDGNKRVSDAQARLGDELRQQELDGIEANAEARIKFLRDRFGAADQFAIGTIGKLTTGLATQPADIAQQQLDLFREERRRQADQDRIRELRRDLADARAEALKELEKAQKELEIRRKEESEAIKKNTEAIDKLRASIIDQQSAVQNTESNLSSDIEMLGRNRQSYQDQLQLQNEMFGPQASMSSDMIKAQTEANSAAMQQTDFSSTSIESLITTTNNLMLRLQSAVRGIDASARYTA